MVTTSFDSAMPLEEPLPLVCDDAIPGPGTADTAGPLRLPVLATDDQAMAERLALLIELAAEPPAAFAVAIERAPRAGSREGLWLSDADGMAVRIDQLDGCAAVLHPDRLDSTVAALDRIDPFLDAIESQTGWTIEPDRVAPPTPGALVFRVEVRGSDGAVQSHIADPAPIVFAIAVPPERAAAVRADPLLPGIRIAAAPMPCTLRATAAFLSVEDAGALAPGDLLLLEAAPWRATLKVGPLGPTPVTIDPVTGQVGGRGRMTGEGGDDASEQLRRFQVPVELALAAGSATLADLAALREGGTLPLGPVTAGLSVTLSVGGTALGTGELVRLGDRFAVVVDRLAPPPAPVPTDVEIG